MKATVLLILCLAVLACASTSRSKSSARDSNRITREEVQNSRSLTVYEMVQQLRPRWLSTRGRTSFHTHNPVLLYVDGAQVGSVDRLREYSPEDIEELRYLDAVNATQRYGTGHRSGAILLFIRRGN